MMDARRSSGRRRKGKPLWLFKVKKQKCKKEGAFFSGEGRLHHYEAAIMDCCLAGGPLMKRGFQLPRSFERNTATIEPQSVALPRPNLELPGFLVGSGPRVFSLAEAGGGSSSAGREDHIT